MGLWHFDSEFYDHSKQLIDDVKNRPNLATTDKYERFFITNIPWLSFSALTHPYSKQYSTVPIISFGKFRLVNGVLSLPVAVQVNHALVDGYHLGQFFEILTTLCDNPATALGL